MTKPFVEPGTAFAQLAGLDGQAPSSTEQLAGGSRAGEASPLVEHFDVVVIGGGQAGLAVGYHLKQRGLRFVILDAHARVGDAWRKRWDSLRLFSPAWLDALDGMPFPGPQSAFPTKDEMGDYLERYAKHFALPVRTKTKVDRLSRRDGTFIVQCGQLELQADQVIVAMAGYQKKRVPQIARELRADIVQLHSSDYRNAAQLKEGSALLVGCGNSGAEIAFELSRTHAVQMAGREVGAVPWRMSRLVAFLLMRVVFHRILTIRTAIGRRLRPKMMHKATPLIRTKPADLIAAGVELVPQHVTGVRDGLPVLEDGRVLDVKNVVWCTGYDAGQSWIDLPIFDQNGEAEHEAGVVTHEPGLYFVGLPFLYSMSSSMVHGVGRDAKRIIAVVEARASAQRGAFQAA